MCMITPFLKYVSEGRVVRRQSDLQRYTFQEITERIYLSFLALTLLKYFDQTAGFVKSYATQTLAYGNFERVRTTTNDLHNMMAIVAGDPEIVQKLASVSDAYVCDAFACAHRNSPSITGFTFALPCIAGSLMM